MEKTETVSSFRVEIDLNTRTLADLSRSIAEKRRTSLDSEIKLSNIKVSSYDIREDRDVSKMCETLKRDGQLLPLTVSKNGSSFIIVNGRTRFEAMQKLSWKIAKCEVYSELDQLEQNYLNATINTNQKTLSTDEKLRFVEQHANQLEKTALSKALGITLGQTEAYVKIANNLDEKAKESLKTQKKGRERGSLEIETARLVSELEDKYVQRDVADYAKALTKKGITDRTRRTEIREKVKTINRLTQQKKTLRMTEREIAKTVIERPVSSLFSLMQISKGSEGKYKAYYDLLINGEFEEVIIFNPTTPYLLGSPSNKSEAFMSLEYSKQNPINLVLVDKDKSCAELWKKQKANIINKTAEEYLVEDFKMSPKKTLLYFNFSGDRTAREFLANPLIEDIKRLRNNVVFAFVIEEEWTSPSNKASNYLELMRFFGLRKNQVKTIEQFFANLGYDFKILWEKRTTRRVALVTF